MPFWTWTPAPSWKPVWWPQNRRSVAHTCATAKEQKVETISPGTVPYGTVWVSILYLQVELFEKDIEYIKTDLNDVAAADTTPISLYEYFHISPIKVNKKINCSVSMNQTQSWNIRKQFCYGCKAWPLTSSPFH